LSSEELRAAYKNTYQVEAEEDASDDELVEAIISATAELPSPKDNDVLNLDEEFEDTYGSLDSDQEHAIPRTITHKVGLDGEPEETDWKDNVVVYQVNQRLVEGELVDLNSTGRYQVYTPEVYNRLLKNKFFAQSKIKVTELSKPSK